MSEAKAIPEHLFMDMIAEMERRMKEPKHVNVSEDGYAADGNPRWLPVDDTQVGVEFAVEYLNRRLSAAEHHIDRLDAALALLDEASGFAAMSPQGRENIVEVSDMLPDLIEQAYRSGFLDGERHSETEHKENSSFVPVPGKGTIVPPAVSSYEIAVEAVSQAVTDDPFEGSWDERLEYVLSKIRDELSTCKAPAALLKAKGVDNISAMALLIKRSIAFADWAAGEGISPSMTEQGTAEDLDPEVFLYTYSQVTGDEDWLSLASRISEAFEDLKAENFELRQQLFLTADKLTREGVEELRSEFEYQRGAEEEFRSHVQELRRERDW